MSLKTVGLSLVTAVCLILTSGVVSAAVNLAPIFPAQVVPGSANVYRVLVSDAKGRPLPNRQCAFRFATTFNRRTGYVVLCTDRNGWATWRAAPPAAWAGTKWINLDVSVDTGEFKTWKIKK